MNNVVAVSADGTITGKAIGECAVKCILNEDESVFKTINIKVEDVPVSEISIKPLSLKVGESKKLEVKVNDNASDKSLEYKSTKEDIATVGSDGTVTGKKECKVDIVATTKDGETYQVIIKQQSTLVGCCFCNYR